MHAALRIALGAGTGGVGKTPAQRLFQRFIDSHDAVTPTPVMASPPTITHRGDYAGSDVTGGYVYEGAPTIAANDARTVSVSGLIADKGSGNYGAAYVTENGGLTGFCKGWGKAFRFTGTAFDIAFNGWAFTGDKRFRVRVNGQWTHAADQANPTNQAAVSKVTFAAPVTNALVEICFDVGVQIFGFNLNAGATITSPDFSGDLTGIVIGDSYTQGFNGDQVRGGIPHLLGERLGLRNIIASGVGSQGWAASSSGHTFVSRIVTARDVARFPGVDLVVLYGSVNDAGQPAATIQANAQAGLADVVASHPDAVKLCLSSFSAAGAVVSAARQNAVRDGFVAAADERTIVLDLAALGLAQVAGSGGDAIHPSPAECASIAAFIAGAAVNTMRARV